MSKLRVGVVGVGRHGSRYARHAARDVEGVELVAVCRRDASQGQALADELGCAYTPDAFELLARDDLDGVILVTVPNLIEGFVEAAVATGKRLLVEKPVAPDPVVGGRILRMIEDSGTYCMAGHTLRFNAACNALRGHVPSVGRIDSLVFTQRFPPQLQLAWLDDPARSGGGNILHTGVHCFDLIRYLTGLEPDTVSCETRSVYTRATEDHFVAWLTLAGSDALAMVTCSRATYSRNGLIEIAGEHGQLVGEHVLNTLYAIRADGRTDLPVGPAKHTALEALRRFAEDARTGAAPACSYRDGLAAVAVAAACYRAARTGQREPVVMPDAQS